MRDGSLLWLGNSGLPHRSGALINRIVDRTDQRVGDSPLVETGRCRVKARQRRNVPGTVSACSFSLLQGQALQLPFFPHLEGRK